MYLGTALVCASSTQPLLGASKKTQTQTLIRALKDSIAVPNFVLPIVTANFSTLRSSSVETEIPRVRPVSPVSF
jgi:hypothetical protein